MNPRESMLDTLLDEFSSDQSVPLAPANPGPNGSLSGSVHGSMHGSGLNSSFHGSSSHGESTLSASFQTASPYTAADAEELQKTIGRYKRMFREYVLIHEQSLSAESRQDAGPSFADKASTSTSTSSSSSSHSSAPSSTRHMYRNSASEDIILCYRDVPDLFFKPDFSLRVPESFHAALVPASHAKQDQLSRYLDLVEIALLRQIWIRSPAFFRALDDMKGLQAQVASAMTHIGQLRGQIQKLDEDLAQSALRIPQLHRRQCNEAALQSKLASMRKMLESRKVIQMLINMEDYAGALQVVAEAKKLYAAELTGIVSMAKLGQQLAEYEDVIANIMTSKFVNLAIMWDDDTEASPLLLESLADLRVSSTVSSSSSSSSSSAASDLNDQLVSLMQALINVDRLQAGLVLYKAGLGDSIRLVVRTCVSEYLTSFDPLLAVEQQSRGAAGLSGGGGEQADGASADTPFAQRVREMDHRSFLSCLSVTFGEILKSLRRCERVHRFMTKTLEERRLSDDSSLSVDTVEGEDDQGRSLNGVTSSHNSSDNLADKSTSSPTASSPSSQSSSSSSSKSRPALITQTSTDLSSTSSLVSTSKACLSSACDLAQRSVAQLLTLRKDSTIRMPLQEMRELWEKCLEFVASLESVSSSTAYVLRQGLSNQTKAYLDHLHEGCKGKLVNALDNERWTQVDVTPERQREIDKLTSGRSFLSSASSASDLSPLSSSSSSSSAASPLSDYSTASGSGKKKEARQVCVDSTGYKVVWSALLLAETTITYLNVAVSFSPVTTEVITKIVDLIKLFNVRTNQLVLGAGAIQSAARLKSISAKHLANTAQSLGLITALLPHIRTALLALLNPKHHMLLTELDRAGADLLEHHNHIVHKFVSIICDSVDASLLKLRAVDWDRFTGQQCDYFDDIQRNVTALHRVLMETLPPEQLQDVFSRIFAALNRKIPAHFDEVLPSTQAGKQRIMDEVSHTTGAFCRLKLIDCTSSSAQLEEIFKKRYGNNI